MLHAHAAIVCAAKKLFQFFQSTFIVRGENDYIFKDYTAIVKILKKV